MSDKESTKLTRLASTVSRVVLGMLFGLSAAAYTIGVVTGDIGGDRQIDATHLALIIIVGLGVTLLLAPKAFTRLRLLEMKGFKLEMLEEVRERQEQQNLRIKDISLIVPLLFPKSERKHLFNLERGDTKNYQGGHVLRTELRRLRSIGLIRMCGNWNIGDMSSDSIFNLSDYVKLTKLGKRWVRRLREIEEVEEADISND